MITPILNLKVSWPLYDSILSFFFPKKSTTRLKILWLQKSEPHCGIRSTHLASHKVGDLNSVPPVKYRRCHFRNFCSNYWQEELISALLSGHFLWCRKGESVLQSRASYVGDHFFYSHDLEVCFGLAVILQGEVRSWLHRMVWRVIGPA